jgi:hypothetical protein
MEHVVVLDPPEEDGLECPFLQRHEMLETCEHPANTMVYKTEKKGKETKEVYKGRALVQEGRCPHEFRGAMDRDGFQPDLECAPPTCPLRSGAILVLGRASRSFEVPAGPTQEEHKP